MKLTYKTAEYNHSGTIREIRKAFEEANFKKVSLEETLYQILEEFYWRAVKEQKS